MIDYMGDSIIFESVLFGSRSDLIRFKSDLRLHIVSFAEVQLSSGYAVGPHVIIAIRLKSFVDESLS